MSTLTPVFLICSERSGSNLIRVMLDAHPQIAAPPPLHLLMHIFENLEDLANENGPTRTWLIARRRVAKALTRYYDEDFSDDVVDELSTLRDISPRAVVQCLYRRLAGHHGSDVLFVKENNIHQYTYLVMHCFPDAKFVFQVRDPRDYLVSARALRKGRWGNKFGSTRHALEIWRDDQEYGLRALSQLGPERVFLQRYEDLITAPEVILSRLCAFIGLPWDPAMLDYHQSDRTRQSASMGGQWKNLGKQVISNNFGKYKKTLPRQYIRSTEAYLGDLMLRFGYTPDFPRRKKPGLRDVFWPILLEPVERIANNQKGPQYTLRSKSSRQQMQAAIARRRLPYTDADGRLIPVETLHQSGETPRPESRLTGPPLATDSPQPAITRVLAAAMSAPETIALRVQGEDWSYRELLQAAAHIAGMIGTGEPATAPLRIAVYADKSMASYAGILGVLLAGATYVPVNPGFPAGRQQQIFERSAVTRVIVADTSAAALARVLDANTAVTQVTIPAGKQEFFNKHSASSWPPRAPQLADDSLAYILFTSGSTGEPKGVAITQRNLACYLEAALPHLDAGPTDRFSQMFELTFDLSVHDMFVCWASGSCLVAPTPDDLAIPGDYIERENITRWFSVPSLAHRMRLAGDLSAGRFSSIRMSLFCGEALPAALAQDWLAATGNASLENWYGPTEATIACTRYAVTAEPNRANTDELVPIGRPLAGMSALIIDENRQPVAEGTPGELYLSGEQLAAGYINDENRTNRVFVALPDQQGRYYHTGDRAICRNGELHFIGRTDNQVKVRGFRIELGDIERSLRNVFGGANSVALTWPRGTASPEYILGAIEGSDHDVQALIAELREQLPDYMVPANVFCIDTFPTSASGKTDRNELGKLIEARLQNTGSAPHPGATNLAERLLDAIYSINPSLDVQRIKTTESLLAAGMDSIGFVRLTVEIEQRFGIELDQETAAAMSRMPFADLVSFLTSGANSADIPAEQAAENTSAAQTKRGTASRNGKAADVLNLKSSKRANRAAQFVENFPTLINTPGAPLWLLLGSSGTLRAFAPPHIDKLAAQTGHPVHTVNAGLLNISCAGMVPVCEFIRRTLNAAGVRAAGIVWELDPMQISSSPHAGEGRLPESVWNSTAMTKPLGSLHAEFEWDAEKSGYVEYDEERIFKRQRAAWEKKREQVIAETYAGRVEFVQEAIDAYVECTLILRDISETLVGFIHPLRNQENLSIQDAQTNLFKAAITQIEKRTRLHFIMPGDFSIPESSFININHVNPWDGSRKANRLLVNWLQQAGYLPGSDNV